MRCESTPGPESLVSRGARKRSRRGFTLLESVAALVIIGLTSAAVLASFGVELRTAARVGSALEGEALARERLATLRLLSDAQRERLHDSLARGRFAAPFDRYQWRASSVRRSELLLELRVEVSWRDGAYVMTTREFVRRPMGSAR